MPKPSPSQPNFARGFTLVEVLAAMALIALAAMAMIKVLNESIVTTGMVRERLLADMIAENRLIESLAAPTAADADTSAGRVTMAGQDWLWTETLARTADPAQAPLSADGEAAVRLRRASPPRRTTGAAGAGTAARRSRNPARR